MFDSRLPEETAIAILEHVAEGVGMRKTGRLLKVDHETVSRYTKLAGEHAEQELSVDSVQFSETDHWQLKTPSATDNERRI